MPIVDVARTSMMLGVTALAGCAAGHRQHPRAPVPRKKPVASKPVDPCHHGATLEEAHRCLDRAEAIKRSGGDGAPQLAAKVCGDLHDPHDNTRCFNLGVIVK